MKKLVLALGVIALGIVGQMATAGDKAASGTQSAASGIALTVQGNATAGTSSTSLAPAPDASDEHARTGTLPNSLTINGIASEGGGPGYESSSSSTSSIQPADGQKQKTKSNIKND